MYVFNKTTINCISIIILTVLRTLATAIPILYPPTFLIFIFSLIPPKCIITKHKIDPIDGEDKWRHKASLLKPQNKAIFKTVFLSQTQNKQWFRIIMHNYKLNDSSIFAQLRINKSAATYFSISRNVVWLDSMISDVLPPLMEICLNTAWEITIIRSYIENTMFTDLS